MKVSPCAPFQLKLFNDIFNYVFFIHFSKQLQNISGKTFSQNINLSDCFSICFLHVDSKFRKSHDFIYY